jgi:hypothetical protein
MIRIYMSRVRSATAIGEKKKPGSGFPAVFFLSRVMEC